MHSEAAVLDDILAPGLKLVICGTAAGSRSALLKHYYAGPGNKLWRTLEETGLTRRRLDPAEAHELLGYGIGLTDLVKGQSGDDRDLVFERSSCAVLREKLLRYAPSVLCFNGKRAAQEFFGTKAVSYGLQSESVGVTALFVAPSTSAAANGSWDLAYWQELAALIEKVRA